MIAFFLFYFVRFKPWFDILRCKWYIYRSPTQGKVYRLYFVHLKKRPIKKIIEIILNKL